MAPLKHVRKQSSDRKLQSVLEVAEDALGLLVDRTQIPVPLRTRIEDHIRQSFPISYSAATVGKAPILDNIGSGLWNAATNLLRDTEGGPKASAQRQDHTLLVVLLRVFAFFLLDTAFRFSSKRCRDTNQLTRIFKVGLKACRFCLDNNELELALKALERCSDHVSGAEEQFCDVHTLEKVEHNDCTTKLRFLVAEFYLLRVAHAWKSERLDLAEHFFSKLSQETVSESAELAESAADLFYEVGQSLLKKALGEPATEWLERALWVLDSCESGDMSPDVGELRLAITYKSVKALLSRQNQTSLSKATSLVEQLSATHGFCNRLLVQLMQVNVCAAEQPPDVALMQNLLCRMARSIVLTEHNFKLFMQKVHQASRTGLEVACHTLDELIIKRLLPDVIASQTAGSMFQEWIERACVAYTLFATGDSQRLDGVSVNRLTAVLDEVTQRSPNAFSHRATHAAQILIWKKVGVSDGGNAEKWCKLLRHPLFDRAGQLNKAVISRKLMTLALSRDDLKGAREEFYRMPPTAQSEGISQYLAFKLALRANDHTFARECLQVVTKYADRDPTFLYACTLEAQQSSMRSIAVTALQSILDKMPPGAHLPALLRCTARLLVGELSTQELSTNEVFEQIVQIFENAAANLNALQKATDHQWQSEIQWWSKNAYNLSLQLCTKIHPEHLVRLLTVCVKFLDKYPGNAVEDGVTDRLAVSLFLSASAYIVLARAGEEGSERRLNSYLHARKAINAFKAAALPEHHPSNETTKHTERLLAIQKFELESILQLRQWDALDASLDACLQLPNIDRWDTLADLVLIVHERTVGAHSGPIANPATTARLAALLNRIVNETWRQQKDMTKAARWLRLSFSVDLTNGRSGRGDGDAFAFKMLEQAAAMAQRSCTRAGGAAFPEPELQWIAVTAFNRAVDFLSAGEPHQSDKWINGALELAQYAADNGALHAHLTLKKAQMKARATELYL